MNAIDGFIPNELRSFIEDTVIHAMEHGGYETHHEQWKAEDRLSLLYFEYLYAREVITNYILANDAVQLQYEGKKLFLKSLGG